MPQLVRQHGALDAGGQLGKRRRQQHRWPQHAEGDGLAETLNTSDLRAGLDERGQLLIATAGHRKLAGTAKALQAMDADDQPRQAQGGAAGQDRNDVRRPVRAELPRRPGEQRWLAGGRHFN